MPARRSAGIVLFRRSGDDLEVLLGHMGGPFWANKSTGAWTIPKGELAPDEDPLVAAEREFVEEIGRPVPHGPRLPLGDVRQKSGKVVSAWAVEGDMDPKTCTSNTVTIEWPPRSGRIIEIPELDRAQWWTVDAAATMVVAGQATLLERLRDLLGDVTAP